MHTEIFNIFVIFIFLCSAAYLLFAIFAVELFNRKRKKKPTNTKPNFPVTVLKPVYGLDPEMLDNLRSFCKQDYPTYQIVFGVNRVEQNVIQVNCLNWIKVGSIY